MHGKIGVVPGEFHLRDGFTYERHDDGEVTIRQYEDARLEDEPLGEITVTPGEWASVVAAMSASGETAESHAAALAFHAR